MAINDLPILSALRTKMQWHQERQRVPVSYTHLTLPTNREV